MLGSDCVGGYDGSAPRLLTETIVTADIRLIQKHKITVRLRDGFLTSDISVVELRNLTKSIFCGGNLSSAFFLWPTTPLFDTFRYWSVSVFSAELFSASFLTNLATSIVKAGRLAVLVATSFATRGSVRHLWHVLFTAFWKAELWNSLMIDRLTTVQITDEPLLSGIYSIVCPTSPTNRTMVSSATLRILVSLSRTVLSSQAHEPDWVVRILYAVCSSYAGQSVMPSSVF